MPIAVLGLSGHCNGYRAIVAVICNNRSQSSYVTTLGNSGSVVILGGKGTTEAGTKGVEVTRSKQACI